MDIGSLTVAHETFVCKMLIIKEIGLGYRKLSVLSLQFFFKAVLKHSLYLKPNAI